MTYDEAVAGIKAKMPKGYSGRISQSMFFHSDGVTSVDIWASVYDEDGKDVIFGSHRTIEAAYSAVMDALSQREASHEAQMA